MFYINLQGKQPIYEQIRQQITRFVELGVLKPNEQLPSVRQLAQENGINPNTVAKAYQQLEKEGVIYTMQKKGAYVAERSRSSLYDQEKLINYLKPLKEGGVSREELLTAVSELFKEEN
ncbi:MAG: GntR family transcriptional regulator [Erysipelotrichaceae bacterium]|nr:GntR family transcriptional regulator [Erysipelotrichaceae bacterium]